MPKVKLTDRNVATIEHEEQEAIFWDTDLPGFGLRVMAAPSTRKTFILRYRNQKKQQRFMTLGREDIINAGKARKMALGVLSKVADGLDPAKARRDAAQVPTLEQLMDRYLEDYAVPNKKETSVNTDKINILQQIYPNIRRSKKVDEISKQDVDKMKANLKGKQASFNRARAVLSKAMELAEEWGYRHQNSNPCRNVRKYKLENRERFLSTEEFASLGKVLAEAN